MFKTEIIEKINKTREYLDYIEDHYNNVQKAWAEIQGKCYNMPFITDKYRFTIINEAVKTHDLSKLTKFEFIQYRMKFFPTELEIENRQGPNFDHFDQAWENHKNRNPHHWENWTKNGIEYNTISETHCVHMVIDWMAMSYKFGDTAKEFYEKRKPPLPKWAHELINKIFDRVYK